MQTALPQSLLDTAHGREAGAILRSCVHCGFCNATCPTYQLLGDELDGPRGRIYLIKQMLEGADAGAHTLTHLDRCLTCRNCETTCPSGVKYSRLLDIGREAAEARIARPRRERLVRWLLRTILPYPTDFAPLLHAGQWLRPLLPRALKRKVPPRQKPQKWPASNHARRMLVLDGCVQSVLAPNINAAAARAFDRLGITLVKADRAGCCGAVGHHTSGVAQGLEQARHNINAWWPHIERGVEAIVMTASGCGVHVKDYGYLLRDDPAYADKAQRVALLTKDLSEIVASEDLSSFRAGVQAGRRIAFQSPCTLQHGQQLGGAVEKILGDLGFVLTPVPEAHLCCGSAGTYSILQRDLAQQLLARKLGSLESGAPECIATANIGCLAHLATASRVPVCHWVELL
jgi:glycolate oxidase iron-sulfur subunit